MSELDGQKMVGGCNTICWRANNSATKLLNVISYLDLDLLLRPSSTHELEICLQRLGELTSVQIASTLAPETRI